MCLYAGHCDGGAGMEALDFQVEIGRGAGQSYDVTWRAPDGSETSGLTRIPVSADELRALAARIPEAVLASSAQVRRSVAPEERPIQDLGRLLFDALLPGNGRALLAAARHRAAHEERRLRVILRVRPPELARLPWEFLFDESHNDYVCPTTTLIRNPQVAAPLRPLSVRPPLRILCMAAAPDDQEPLAIRAEQQRLGSALAGLEREGLIELGWTAGDTWRDLRTALRRSGDAQWHVFHFIGHGGFDAAAQEGTLRLSGEGGGTYDLGAENLAMVLESRPSLRLVVLNACETGRSSAADPFSSVAGALLQRGVPAALAMQFPISDRAAEEFSRTFYEGLAHRMPVDAAVTDARQAIRLALRGTLEWGTPVLYMRSLDGLLFDLRAAPARRSDTGELHDLYVQGLAALYTERWDDAVAAFRGVVAQDPAYQSGTAKLNEAVRGRRLASLYAAGAGAADHGHWDAAVEHLGAVVAAEPGYRDAAERLRQARHEQTVARLRTEISDLHRATQWQAVLAVGERLAALCPTAPDPDGLVAAARRATEEAAVQATVQDVTSASVQDLTPATVHDMPSAAVQDMPSAAVQDMPSAAVQDMPPAAAPEPPGPEHPATSSPQAPHLDPPGTTPTPAEPRAVPVGFEPAGRNDPAPVRDDSLAVRGSSPAEEREPVAPARAESTAEWGEVPPGDGTAEAVRGVVGPLWRPEPSMGHLVSGFKAPPRPLVPPVVGWRPEPVRPGDVRISWGQGAWSFGFSRDGSRVAVGYQNGDAHVLDLGGHVVVAVPQDTARTSTSTRAARLLGARPSGAVTCLALTPNGGQLTTAQYGTVRIWSATRGVELRRMRLPDAVCAMSFSPIGHRAVFATLSSSAYVWDTDEPTARRRRLRLDGRPHRLAWTPDGVRFATAGPSGVRVWNALSGTCILEVGRNQPALDVALSPLGARLAVAQGASGARVLDARSGVEVLRLGSPGAVSRVAFNHDGTRLATADRGRVEVWDMRSGAAVTHRRTDSRWSVETVVFGPDGAARAVVREPEAVWLIRIGEEHDG